jgi:hypothetical protein
MFQDKGDQGRQTHWHRHSSELSSFIYMAGLGVGNCIVGPGVGGRTGAMVGERVGRRGAMVGLGVGNCIVGPGVGGRTGAMVGERVGRRGAMVGLGVGNCIVGRGVGGRTGAMVGDRVGRRGAMVGLGVGNCIVGRGVGAMTPCRSRSARIGAKVGEPVRDIIIPWP